MATNNRSGNRGGNNSRRRGQNNNPEGHNQYDRGWMDSAKDRPFTAAAAVGGAVAAGVFLWSRRNQISDQITNLTDQISDWREGMSDAGAEGGNSFIARPAKRNSKSQKDFATEALMLKGTGKKIKRPTDDTIDRELKTGAISY